MVDPNDPRRRPVESFSMAQVQDITAKMRWIESQLLDIRDAVCRFSLGQLNIQDANALVNGPVN